MAQILRKKDTITVDDMKKEAEREARTMWQFVRTFLKWLVIAGVTGSIGGLVGSAFHLSVNWAATFRAAHPWLLWLLPIGGLLIAAIYRLTKMENKNTNAIIDAIHFGDKVPLLLVPAIYLSTVITHLFGGSAGREGAALQIGTYAAPMLAAFLLIPVLDEYGPKYALLLYATVSILSVLLVPELELAFFYVFVIGYYPVLRQQLARIKSTLLRWVIKFAVFNGATVLVYLLLFALLGPAILDELLADGVGMLAALLAAGNLSFWLCDRAVGALTRYYRLILKKKLKFLH